MDGRTFDTIVRYAATAQSRRRAVTGLGALALGALGLGEAAAQEAATCRLRLERCSETADCCEKHDVACRRLSRRCREETELRRERCCGVRGATCADNCDCCGGFRCRDNRCR